MAKVKGKVEFACTACGTSSPKWVGKCPGCGEWNTLVEEVASSSPRQRAGMPDFPVSRPVRLTEVEETAASRTSCGIAEFDRVMGGGVVAASATLLGGDPGIGKSTILLQAARGLARHGRPVLYVSGEESEAQVKLRASRLGVTEAGIYLMSETSVERILSATGELSPGTLIVDSIQTVFSSDLPGAPGSVGQVRECAARLTFFGKKAGVAVFLVGHVTKEGAIAGPRMLEHLVDTVLYFERDAGSRFRRVRAAKNRFGAANELGFFLMPENGLREVRNPAAIFLTRAPTPVVGSLVMVTRDGTRPLLVEVQGLTDASRFGSPRRVAQGIDAGRLAMVLAVLSRHGGVALQEHDVFANVVGGLDIDEPAWDLRPSQYVSELDRYICFKPRDLTPRVHRD